MKRITALLLSLLLVFTLFGCQKAAPQKETEKATEAQPTETVTVPVETVPEETEPVETEPEETEPEEVADPSSPILYKVTDADGNVIYMLGSIHVGIEEMYPMPQYVMDAYNSCDALAVECDIIAAESDMKGAFEAVKLMLLTDGTTISDHISPECYEKAVEILEENKTYYGALDMYKPVLWYSLISQLTVESGDFKTDLGVDQHFLELAYEEDKAIIEVESIMEQYTMLANMSMELQALMLEEAVASYGDPAYTEYLLAMCSAWAKGDLEQLVEQIDSNGGELPTEQAHLLEEFNSAMEGQRNVNMTQFAKDCLAEGGSVFIIVGAAHVLGDDGMATSLAAEGYTVEQVK